jgi:hypothetical protein
MKAIKKFIWILFIYIYLSDVLDNEIMQMLIWIIICIFIR